MTFDEFFAANWKDLPGVDRNANAQFKTMARESLKACWNAAIDAVVDRQLTVLAVHARTAALELKVSK